MNSIILKIMMLNEQIKAFRKDEKGVTMVEYSLLAVLVAIGAVVGATTLGSNLSTTFTDIGKKILY
jgi:pilus assembly protein Flp/PilA